MLLPNGKILTVGGYNGSVALANTEIYDPASNNWSSAGSLSTRRDGHTIALLPSGKVLSVSGGHDYIGGTLASVDLFNPGTVPDTCHSNRYFLQ